MLFICLKSLAIVSIVGKATQKATIRTNKIKTPNLRSLTAIITRPFAK